MKRLHPILLGLIGLSLATALHAANPCATGGAPMMRDGSGAGGTGLWPEAGDGTGQGGTGVSPRKLSSGDGSGSGGTGISLGNLSGGDGSGSGGTGYTVEVEGVITGFASICVNGLELHYLPTTPVTIYGDTASSKDLKVGQVVRALAHGQGDQLALQRIRVSHLLIAQVQKLEPGNLRAQGRNISLGPDAVLPSGLIPGVKVAVSGFVGAHGYSVATRLDVVPDDTPDSLTGEVQRNAQGELTVDGVPLVGNLARLEPGEIVRAEGLYAEGRMQITRFEREERAMPVDRVVIQGFVRHTAKSEINVSGQRFLIDSKTLIKQALPRAGEWAKVDAIREGHQFRAREVDTQARPGNEVSKPFQGKDSATQRAGSEEKTRSQEQGRSSGTDVEHSSRETEKVEVFERPEASEKPETPEKVEAPERIERPEKVEAPERVERPEKIEAPERVERPEKIEAPERVERPERIERED